MALSCVSSAQEYPNRSVRLVTIYGPGSAADQTARFLAQLLGDQLKQSVVVENLGGAGGLIATQSVIRSRPLGYSLLLGETAVINNLFAYKQPGYKSEDLALLGPLGLGEYALIINTVIPAKTLEQFVSYAKANPGKLNYGSVGIAANNTLMAERFKAAAGISMEQILFKGGGELSVALLSGQVQAYMLAVGTAKVRMQNPQIVGLAVTGDHRSKILPELPTFKELGYPSMTGTSIWYALMVPSAAPKPIIQRLRDVVATILASPQMDNWRQKYERERWTGTLEEFEQYLRASSQKVQEDFRRANIIPAE
jgi:tripartite-type tricarboxylate transporter receptor subunit TctC